MNVDLPAHLIEKLQIVARLTEQPIELLVAQAVEFWLRGDQGPFQLLDSLCKHLLAQLVNASLDGADGSTIKGLSEEFLEAVDLRGRVTAELRHYDGRSLPQIHARFEAAITAIHSVRMNPMTIEDVERVVAEARREAVRCDEVARALEEQKLEWELRASRAVVLADDNLAKEALLGVAECEREQARVAIERPLFVAHAELLEHGLALLEAARVVQRPTRS